MKSDLSADLSTFVDDELEAHRQPAILAAMGHDEKLRSAWGGYHLIGDSLRSLPALDRDLAARVMACLEQEPVVLAPQVKRVSHLARSSLAIAATAAGVAVVAWVAVNPYPFPQQAQTVALVTSQSPAAAEPATGRLQEYLVAHQAYSPSNRIQGGTSYVRTVSATRNSGTK